MVQDKRDARALSHQLDGQRKLAREDANIEGEPVPLEQPDVLSKQGGLRQLVGLRVEYAADALQLGMAGNLVQVGFEIRLFRAAAGDHPLERIILVRE